MTLGKVTVWYMTEEERLAYIEKHPIVPTDPKESRFTTEAIDYKVATERRKESMKGNQVMDNVDKNKLHELYMSGIKIPKIAEELNINPSTLSTFLSKQRQIEPDKWPLRQIKRKKGEGVRGNDSTNE